MFVIFLFYPIIVSEILSEHQDVSRVIVTVVSVKESVLWTPSDFFSGERSQRITAADQKFARWRECAIRATE